jgi:hypothetical protein
VSSDSQDLHPKESAFAEYRGALDWEELASAVCSDRVNSVTGWRPGARAGVAA